MKKLVTSLCLSVLVVSGAAHARRGFPGLPSLPRLPRATYQCTVYTSSFYSPFRGTGNSEREARLEAINNCDFWDSRSNCQSADHTCKLTSIDPGSLGQRGFFDESEEEFSGEFEDFTPQDFILEYSGIESQE